MTDERPKRATLYDVAALAGVSSQTVSRVINNSEHVSEKLRNRVQQVINELDYQPNRSARSLKTQRTNTLQVVAVNRHYPLTTGMLTIKAQELGYNLVHSQFSMDKPEEFRRAIDDAARLMVDGIIIIVPQSGFTHDDISRLSRGIPLVYIDTYLGANVPSVVINQVMGTRLIMQHLIDFGHKQIAEISGPYDLLIDAKERHETWLQIMQENGLDTSLSIMASEGTFSAKGGYVATQELIERGSPFTAIFCANDNIAIGALNALWEHGSSVDYNSSGF
jgi:DNA-binding LacI/PurR family transcriptional regulator